MRAMSRRAAGFWIVAAAGIVALGAWRATWRASTIDPDFLTGWILAAMVAALAIYGVRRRLPMLPLGRASVWLSVHVVVGVAAIGAYAIHVGTAWPAGAADRALALLFLAVIASGVAGHVLQAILPARLARSGPELIYERIPTEVAKLRAAAEDALVEAAGAAGHETLSSYYAQTLAWYFERPRFALSHVFGGHGAEAWERQRLAAVEKLLSADERPHLAALAELCRHKRAVDAQYALQTLLRAWTFVHVPAATAFLAMAAWHTLIVHVYAG